MNFELRPLSFEFQLKLEEGFGFNLIFIFKKINKAVHIDNFKKHKDL